MVQRRGVLLQVVAVAAGVAGLIGSARAADEVEVTWRVPAPRLQEAMAAVGVPPERVKPDAATVEDTRGLPLLYIVAGAFALPVLAQGLVSVYKDLTRSGATVIDVSGAKVDITHDLKSPADVVIVKDRDGKVTVIPGRPALDAARWLEILASAVRGGGAGGAGK